jgi:tryptophan halogenase
MNIVIVGGGTAGWIAAYFIVKDQPKKHNIIVIESSKIGIIGAGEGSTGTMLELLNGSYFPFKVDLDTFLKETDGTHKFGIYHQNWKGDSQGYFAPIDSTTSWFHYDDYIFKYVFSQYGKEQMHVASPLGLDFARKNWNSPSALHFDGHKVGQFFKRLCEQDGVKTIDAVVDEVVVSGGKVEKLILDNHTELSADFFIDCTGFSRKLMKALDVDWVSYKEYLPVNTAMPFLLNYEEGEEIIPMTTATALSAGWMWNIPLSSRRGCGYVFDINYITKKQAQEEVEQYLGKKIKPIKFINFESGKSQSFWKSNVLTLGLASAFVEPLEATSIHSTIIQMLIFSKEFLFKDANDTLTTSSQTMYNEKINILYDSILDFVSFHYQGGRTDSNFWKDITKKDRCTPRAKGYLEKCQRQIPGFLEIHALIGSPAASLWNWIAAGLDIITPYQAEQELKEKNLFDQGKFEYEQMILPKEKLQKSYINFL